MIVKRKSRTAGNDIQTVYRPCKLNEFFGNKTNKNIIKGNLDNNRVPHSFLFTGAPGCGKTTMARIIALGLNCEEGQSAEDWAADVLQALGEDVTKGPTSEPCLECRSCKSIINHNSMDTMEINVGAYGNKDDVLKVIDDLPTAPFIDRYKVLIMDEAHKLTSASQDVLLKIIEDSYSHVYFIFCTNEPQKLKDAFVERCNVMHFGRLPVDTIHKLLLDVCDGEGIDRSDKNEVLKYLSEESEGVPRKALIWLKQVNDEGSWSLEAAKQVTGLLLDEADPQIIELSRTLLKGGWKKSLALYKDKKMEKMPAESIRIAVAGFFVGCLKRSRTFPEGRKFSKILDVLTVPIYETGKLGQHKLINYMFKVVDLVNTYKK